MTKLLLVTQVRHMARVYVTSDRKDANFPTKMPASESVLALDTLQHSLTTRILSHSSHYRTDNTPFDGTNLPSKAIPLNSLNF